MHHPVTSFVTTTTRTTGASSPPALFRMSTRTTPAPKRSFFVLQKSITTDSPEEDNNKEETQQEEEEPKVAVKCPDCDQCDGSGRIEGGIGVVLTFWPIKAYRPCPNFIERGGVYQRSGQPLDEIAFGRDSTYDSDTY